MPDGSDDESALPVSRPSSTEPARSPQPRAASPAPHETRPEASPVARRSPTEPTRSSEGRTASPAGYATSPEAHTTSPASHTANPEARAATPGPHATSSEAPADTAPQLRDPDRYVVLGEHGRGGLGRVSRAHDRELGRDIAIKELISRGDVSEARFLREALITARLEHPGIVPVHEAGRWPDGTPFYAMKLVAGRPLRDVLAEKTTVDSRIALLHHVIAVADAIAYAHGRNIIHRDLKPSNVIIGDFGETVVIDWGLAKDLSISEEPNLAVGSPSANRDEHLTSTGSVLGTPAYMPPEQLRGEAVDQRADVYAIGAMLWELCTLEKLPPNYSGQRRRILRRAGIDQDLATIVQKALDPDPARRYPDASVLAADLKAFKAGARIAARRYSLWALLAHWTRRHRAFSLSIGAVIAIAATASILYVRNITTERDRADMALERAHAAQNELILEHAALLLQSDPTAATNTLDTYRGNDTMRRSELLAEARGRGVARSVLRPHNDTVTFLAGQPDGSFISVGEDHRIQRTRDGVTTNVATNVSYTVRTAYSPMRNLLAYTTSPSGVALLDLTSLKATALHSESPNVLTFSSDGTRLATLDNRGMVVVWDIASTPSVHYRFSSPGMKGLLFFQGSRLLLFGRSGLLSLDLQDSSSLRYDAAIEAVDASDSYIMAALTDGALVALSPSLKLLATTPACKQRLPVLKIMKTRDLVAFVCDEGTGGVARYLAMRHTIDVIDMFNTAPAPWLVTADRSERYIWAISKQTAYSYDVESKLTKHLEGQPALISAIETSSAGFPYIITGDVNGGVRLWDLPASRAHAIAQVPGLPTGSRYSPDGATLAIFGTNPDIRLLRLDDGSITQLHGHTGMIGDIRFSADGRLAISASWDGTARVWRASDGALLNTFEGHGAIVEDSDFLENGARAVSIADDGRLLVWESTGTKAWTYLANELPLSFLQVLSNTNDMITCDTAGSVWSVSPAGRVRRVRSGNGTEITNMRASRDGRFLAIGQEDGALTIYHTSDWNIAKIYRTGGTVARIEIDPQSRDILVLSEDGFVHMVPLDADRNGAWRDLQLRAHDLAYSPDGDIVTVSALDGGSWFYSIPEARWSYQRDHNTEVWSGRFSPNGKHFVSIDRDGSVVVRNRVDLFD